MLESTNNSLNSVEFLVQQHKMRKRTPKKSKKMRPLEMVKNGKPEKEEYETPEKDEKWKTLRRSLGKKREKQFYFNTKKTKTLVLITLEI